MTNHHEWLPPLTDTAEIEAALAATQPHLRELSRKIVHLEDTHEMMHQHPLTMLLAGDDTCERFAAVIEEMESAMERGIKGLWS